MTIEAVNSHIDYVVSKIADQTSRVFIRDIDEIAPALASDPRYRILDIDEKSAVVICSEDLYNLVAISLKKALDNITVKSDFRDQMKWRMKEKATIIALESE